MRSPLQPYKHPNGKDGAPATDPGVVCQAPKIRLPILGGGSLQVELIGVGYGLGAIVRGDVRRQRGQNTELFLLDGPLILTESPHSLWIHVGSLAFRTDLTQQLAIQDFIEEVRRYSYERTRARRGNGPDA